MTIKVLLRTAGLLATILHKVDGQHKKQIYYEDTQNNQYRQQYTSLTEDPPPFPPYEQPKIPAELSAPSSYPYDPIHTSGGASYEPDYSQDLQKTGGGYAPALPYAPSPPLQLPPVAPYSPPASYPPPAPPLSYSPVAPYAPPPALPAYVIPPTYPAPAPAYPAPAPAYPAPAYSDSYIAPAATGYDSYSQGYESGGYDSYGKGYKKPYKEKGYHDIIAMKKYYLLKIFGSLVKAKGGLLVGIGKLLKLKGKMLLAKGEALEDVGYYLKEIKDHYFESSYGYEDSYPHDYKGKGHKSKGYGYGDHKSKGTKFKLPKKPKKGYGVPYDDPYGPDDYLDYKRKGKEDNPYKDMSTSGSNPRFQAEKKEIYASSQGPPIPLTSVEPPKKPEPPKPPPTLAPIVKGKPIGEVNRAKGDSGSLETHAKTTPKPKYSVRVTKPKLRTTTKPPVVSTAPKTETGFQPMFDYDSSESIPEPQVRDGWSPVKFF